jgi:cell division protein FtsB
MPQINIRKIIYTIRHKYWTFNNIVIAVAFLITASWVWGSLQVMQRNFALQKEVDQKARQLELTELQAQSLELQQRYYQTDEYRELAARESLGLVMPGESVVILPENSQAALDADKEAATTIVSAQPTESNLEQWLNFLFGGYSRTMNNDN